MTNRFLDAETGVVRKFPKPRPTTDEPSLFAPVVPAARTTDPTTSNDGLADVLPRAGSQQYKLLLAYGARPMGLTAEEAADIAGLAHTGFWRRVSELLREGYLCDTYTTRVARSGSRQRVLAISDRGKQAIYVAQTQVPG